MQCTWTLTKRFTLSAAQRKCPMSQQYTQNFSLHWRNGAFFHTAWNNVRYAISSHCFSALLAKMSAFNRYMRQNAYYRSLRMDSKDLLPCYCFAIKTNSRTTTSQVSQPASADKGAGMSELQAHHCMTPEQWTWILCSVNVLPANRLSLQELSQLIK